MMIALTAALKVGKATFSGNLLKKFRYKMKEASLTERRATKFEVERTGRVTS